MPEVGDRALWVHISMRGGDALHSSVPDRCLSRRVGRRRWKQEVGYHRRSLAETGVSRYKRCFGDRLSARTFAGQCTEVFLRGALLNRFTWLGRPESYPVAA